MKPIVDASIPNPGGHYSACIEHSGLLYISGQLPVLKDSGEVPDGIVAQTELVLQKLDNILRAAGSAKQNVLQTRIYISDINDWNRVNEVYAEFFGEHRPARAIVPTNGLHFGALIELEATAFVNPSN